MKQRKEKMNLKMYVVVPTEIVFGIYVGSGVIRFGDF